MRRGVGLLVGLAITTGRLGAAPFPDWSTWQPSSGPYGGVVNVMGSFDASLYAGTERGLYRSEDGGASWRLSSIPLEATIRALAQVEDALLAGGPGIFRSPDGGETWTSSNQGLPRGRSPLVTSLTVSGRNVFALVNGTLFVSRDGGVSWTATGAIPAPLNSILAVGDALYGAGTSFSPSVLTGGVYESDDEGRTWRRLELPAVFYVRSVYSVDGVLYAVADTGLYRSSDRGSHWLLIGSDLPRPVNSLIGAGRLLYAGCESHGVFRSDDGGDTWIPTAHPATSVLSLASRGSVIYSGTRFGINESDDGGNSWAAQNRGLTNTTIARTWVFDSDVYALVVVSDALGLAEGRLYRSIDSGESWVLSGAGLPPVAFLFSLVMDGNALYAGFFRSGVYKSIDRGSTWAPVGPGLPVAADALYTVVARDGIVLVAVMNQVFRSADNGRSWTGPAAGLDARLFLTSMVFAGNAIYGGTDSGVVKSVDDGLTWQPTDLQQFTRLLAASPDAVYAVTSGSGVFRTTDGGHSWDPTALARNDIYSIVESGGWIFAANIGDALGAGQRDEVFVSGDRGATWSTLDERLFALGGVSLAASSNVLYAGTRGYGVQTLELRPDRPAFARPTPRPVPRLIKKRP